MKKITKLPVATYRLQLNHAFTFEDAGQISDYLRGLNISHIYLSPILESGGKSTHGYDVTDFSRISEERGGLVQFQDFVRKISESGSPLKLILDIVPNHMAASTENPYWNDVLVKGPQSAFWSLFDIKIRKSEKIEIPVLAEGQDNEIKIARTQNGYCLKYYENEYPLSEDSLSYLKSNPDADISKIIGMQHYALVPWTDAFHSVSYRRFFDVMGLIGLKTENENVYKQTHAALFKLLADFSCIDGVRVDHIDGLADPATYLARLSEQAPSVWIEKILGREEELPPEWKTHGTTGYEFIDRINQLLVHKDNFKTLENFWRGVAKPEWENFAACVFASRQRVLNDLFLPELERLVACISRNETEQEQAKIFWSGLLCGLPVYRVYAGQNLEDNEWLIKACETASLFLGDSFAQARETFLPRLIAPDTDTEIRAAKEWQQLSGPVMAKGLEDTAHYRFTPLTALNDVGCQPVILSSDRIDYCDWMKRRAQRHPFVMNATSTHDTKRSEDTRARLYALADKPQEWMDFFALAQSINAGFKKGAAPSPATEYFLYQSILGTWPLDGKNDSEYAQRIKDYMQKADREARQETQWITPDKAYEENISEFTDNILSHKPFTEAIDKFAGPLSRLGAINSLSVLILKILAPGIPDIYQGMEHWDFSLVDPDNRRAVDYDLRQRLLSATDTQDNKSGRSGLMRHLSESWKDGAIKIWLTRELLKIRKDHLIDKALLKVTPLDATGKYADNLIAYTLTDEDKRQGLLVLCPRYPGLMPDTSGLSTDWSDTEIVWNNFPGAAGFKDLLRGEKIAKPVRASDMLADFPLAVISFDIIS